jgi:hypothetical protein
MLLLRNFEVIGYMPIVGSDLSEKVCDFSFEHLAPSIMGIMDSRPNWTVFVFHLYNKNTDEEVYISYVRQTEAVCLFQFANKNSKSYVKVVSKPTCSWAQFAELLTDYVDSVKRQSEREYHVVFKSPNAMFNAINELQAEEGFEGRYEVELKNGDFITMSCNNELPL